LGERFERVCSSPDRLRHQAGQDTFVGRGDARHEQRARLLLALRLRLGRVLAGREDDAGDNPRRRDGE
jgi:hypothetical protein